ncbi:MAG TPA: 3-phenylpropionate/cinnamic acid dioxygenase subunit beta [Pseudonocardia sp.]
MTLALDVATVLEVHAFLAQEARLLDAERYPEWLELFTDDAHYWMPGVENRSRSDPMGSYGPQRMAYFDDDVSDLRKRIQRFMSATAWAEDPPTRHLHVVSNVEVEPGERTDELRVHSVVVNYRAQHDLDAATLYGRREDVLRRVAGELRIARRTVVLPHAALPAKNLNTFL